MNKFINNTATIKYQFNVVDTIEIKVKATTNKMLYKVRFLITFRIQVNNYWRRIQYKSKMILKS